jgi:hypothetical protein
LYCHGRKEPLLHVIRDAHYPEMWRAKLPDGRLSDMVNLTWAEDSAATIAIAQAAKETGLGNSPRGFRQLNRTPLPRASNKGFCARPRDCGNSAAAEIKRQHHCAGCR